MLGHKGEHATASHHPTNIRTYDEPLLNHVWTVFVLLIKDHEEGSRNQWLRVYCHLSFGGTDVVQSGQVQVYLMWLCNLNQTSLLSGIKKFCCSETRQCLAEFLMIGSVWRILQSWNRTIDIQRLITGSSHCLIEVYIKCSDCLLPVVASPITALPPGSGMCSVLLSLLCQSWLSMALAIEDSLEPQHLMVWLTKPSESCTYSSPIRSHD